MSDRLATMTAATFASGATSPFRVVTPGTRPVPLRLVDVSEVPAPGTSQFSLIFSGSADEALPQGMRRVSHDTLGEFPLFLVPVGRDGGTVLYQAVFNRMLDRR